MHRAGMQIPQDGPSSGISDDSNHPATPCLSRVYTPTQTLSATKLRGHTPTQTLSATKLRRHTPTQTLSATQLRGHTPTRTLSATKLRRHTPTQILSATNSQFTRRHEPCRRHNSGGARRWNVRRRVIASVSRKRRHARDGRRAALALRSHPPRGRGGSPSTNHHEPITNSHPPQQQTPAASCRGRRSFAAVRRVSLFSPCSAFSGGLADQRAIIGILFHSAPLRTTFCRRFVQPHAVAGEPAVAKVR
jgi:hypothetical protein